MRDGQKGNGGSGSYFPADVSSVYTSTLHETNLLHILGGRRETGFMIASVSFKSQANSICPFIACSQSAIKFRLYKCTNSLLCRDCQNPEFVLLIYIKKQLKLA
jgi:hypothetical protein